MEAVYTLLNIDRGVPEVFGSCYDVRVLLDSTSKLMDGKKLTAVKLPFEESLFERI
jgi:oleate hydratase